MRSFPLYSSLLLAHLVCHFTVGFTTSATRQRLELIAYSENQPQPPANEAPVETEDVLIPPPPPLLDPYSKESIDILRNDIHLSTVQITQIQRLAMLVCDWNTRINLVSRKDCSPSVVFSRHILPSLCYTTLPPKSTVMDVGTGGGFPGIVLAIQHPSCEFILLDAIGKKLIAVADMVQQLSLDNVKKVHHGRVEDYERHSVDVVTGRGVSDLRAFMGATQHLMRSDESTLVYWAGGDMGVDERQWCEASVQLRDAIPSVMEDGDDKRILTFGKAAVNSLAKGNGRRQNQNQQNQQRQNKPAGRASRQSKPARGSWSRRDASEKKQRGYEGFQRYDSSSRAPTNSEY